jgi:hypothetical protein
MYAFKELKPGSNWCTSVAYWIGTLHRPLPKSHSTSASLAAAMSMHFDIEEQCCDEEHLRTTPELLFEVFRPVAPVTLSERWTPFRMFLTLFENPIRHGVDTEKQFRRSAFAIFNPVYLGDSEFRPKNRHEEHALFLARLAASRAEEEKAKILVVAQPGWSYSHAFEAGLMNPQSALFMHRVGYIYTERLPLTRKA